MCLCINPLNQAITVKGEYMLATDQYADIPHPDEVAQAIVDNTYDGDFLTWSALKTDDGKIDYKMLGEAFVDLVLEVYAPYEYDKNMSPNREINRLMNKAERDTQVKEFLEYTFSRWASETQSMRGAI